jgi:hypothetical protein
LSGAEPGCQGDCGGGSGAAGDVGGRERGQGRCRRQGGAGGSGWGSACGQRGVRNDDEDMSKLLYARELDIIPQELTDLHDKYVADNNLQADSLRL